MQSFVIIYVHKWLYNLRLRKAYTRLSDPYRNSVHSKYIHKYKENKRDRDSDTKTNCFSWKGAQFSIQAGD